MKRCLKANIRKIYLFCDEGRREASDGVEVPAETSRPPQHKSGREEDKLLFIISVLQTNYFLQSGKTRQGGAIYFFFSLCFFLFSPYFSTDVKMIEIPAGLITAGLQRGAAA